MPATLALVNGPVFTSDSARPFARAVAVEDERIVAVGSEAEIGALVGPGTRVVDLRGRMVCPGFQDAHVHPVHGGFGLLRCDLTPAADAVGAADRIRAYVAAHPDDPWVLGRGWAYPWFERGCPSADLLDDLAGDRPAWLVGADGHSGWANRAALALAGITADTPDPPDGRIERMPDGSAQGTLHEGAMDLVEAAIPPDTPADVERALVAGHDHLLSLGVTAWQDAWVTDEIHAAYLRLEGAGRMRARVRGALWWDREGGMEQLERLRVARSAARGRYRADAVKLMLDGVCENHTASLAEPYLGSDGRPGTTSGLDFIDPDELREIVTTLDAAGFACHFHAIGDAAVRNALDAVERARGTNGWTGNRHHIAHLQVVDPSDVPRFRRLGVTANLQALWACADPAMTELTIPVLGEERSGWQYPFGSLHRAGAVLAMGSDWPVTSADVLEQLSVAIRRMVPGAGPGGEVFLPHERLSLPVALTAFTAGSAEVNGLGADSGTVEVGKRADLVVLDGDLFDGSDPATVEVDMVIVGGAMSRER